MKKITGALAAAGLAMSMSANAALIEGAISMSGGWTPVDAANNPTTIGAATGIQFEAGSFVTIPAPTGDLAFISFLDPVDMTDFQFNPLSPSPVVPLYEITQAGLTLSFDLVTISIGEQISTSLRLEGEGIMNLTGFDPTPGIWRFTGQGAGGTFSWSASSAAVPEPATIGMLGLALAGIAAVRRRRVAAS